MKIYSAWIVADGKAFEVLYLVKKCKYGFKVKWNLSQKLDDIKNKGVLVQQVETEKEAIKNFTKNELFFIKKLEFAFIHEIKI